MMRLHSIYDSDSHFIINPTTRAITAGKSSKTKLVQYDTNSERFTFELPRYIEGHDMSLCNKVEIHYINLSADKTSRVEDVYLVGDVQLSPGSEGVVIFSWLISGNATQYAGSLNFLIAFKCLTGAVIDYAWHTETFKNITVLNGMNNGEAVIVEYSDVLEAWKAEVLNDLYPKITEADEGKFLQVKNGEWKASDTFKVIDNKLYLCDAVLSERGLKYLLDTFNLPTISGLYDVTLGNAGEVSNIKFASNGKTFNKIKITRTEDATWGYLTYLYYDDMRVAEFNESLGEFNFFGDDEYKTIDFGEEPQELLYNEYSWITSVAKKPMITFDLCWIEVEAVKGTLWKNFSYDDGTGCIDQYNGYVVWDSYGGSGWQFYLADENGNKVLITDEIRAGGVYRQGEMIEM